MSAENLPDVPEWALWASPQCAKCKGRGAVRTPEIMYGGWRWCDCAIANRKQRVELDR